MIGTLDPEELETRAIHELVDFSGKDVLEIGCGEGRMTWRFASLAASVLAIDPDESAIATARRQTPPELADGFRSARPTSRGTPWTRRPTT